MYIYVYKQWSTSGVSTGNQSGVFVRMILVRIKMESV